MQVFGVDSQGDMLLQQAAARALTLPTHTFAGSGRMTKERTVMAIGPGSAEVVDQITGHLRELSA
jgi:peptidyl-tRNA hydrolase